MGVTLSIIQGVDSYSADLIGLLESVARMLIICARGRAPVLVFPDCSETFSLNQHAYLSM